MKIELSITELKDVYKLIPLEPEEVQKMVKRNGSKAVCKYLSSPTRIQLEAFLGRKPYEWPGGERNHRKD